MKCVIFLMFFWTISSAHADLLSTDGTIKFDSNSDGVVEMTLNGTGLGIGTLPSANLHVHGEAMLKDLHVVGTMAFGLQSISSNTTLSENSMVLVDTTAATVTLSLPNAANVTGRQYRIKKTSNLNTLWVDGGVNLIDNQSMVALSSSYSGYPYLNVISDGTQWYIERKSTEFKIPGSDNLSAWWKLDEGSGTTAFDSSGQNHNGVITNMAAADIGVTGKFENALEFDTSNDHVFVPSDVALEVQKFTYSFWVKFKVLGSMENLMTYKTNLLTTNGAILMRKETTDLITAFIYDGVDYEPRVSSASAIASAGVWYHVAVTFDQIDLKCYLNSVVTTTARALSVPYATTNNLIIGNQGSFSLSADATIDDFRLYNRALSSDEVIAIYNQGN